MYHPVQWFTRLAVNETVDPKALWDEFWVYIYERFFNPNLNDYEYVSFGEGFFSLNSIIWGLVIGFFLASCMTIFDKHVLGDFVRCVLSEEAVSKEKAKTLSELGYMRNSIIRGALRSGYSLRRVVKCVEEEEFLLEVEAMQKEYEAATAGTRALPFKAPKFKMDPSTMHYYIPEELKYTAEFKFEKKGTNFRSLLLAGAIFLVCAAFIAFFLPDLLQFIDNIIGIFDSKNNIIN